MAKNPYSSLPPEAFWRTAVADVHPFEMRGLWKPKFTFSQSDYFATAGSCFAQHISNALKTRGYNWLDSEPAPPLVNGKLAKAYNYGVFSFRTGNIYTAQLLWQWVRWALGLEEPRQEVFETDGRFFDPFRPAIQPGGFDTAADVLKARTDTLKAIAKALVEADVLVFTLGLTEGWINGREGYVYPVCPGTVAGTFDEEVHRFQNFGFTDIYESLRSALDAIKKVNKSIRFLLTVSPVPLTATAAGKHVLVATTYSKSVLRAVAGAIADTREDTDYFPSFEIITGAPYRAMFFDPNLRTVTPKGVDHVMGRFFEAFSRSEEEIPKEKASRPDRTVDTLRSAEDVVCEDAILEQWNDN